MPLWTDRQYLQKVQYKNGANLQARVRLHQRFSTNPYSWHLWVFDLLDLPERCRVLELGCGSGDLWIENRHRTPATWRITLSDLSESILKGARERLEPAELAFVYHACDAEAIPFHSQTYDVAIANHMLYHTKNLERVLREIRRVLRPGGRLFAATNGLAHLQELRDLVTAFCPDNGAVGLLSRFSLDDGGADLSQHFGRVTRHRQRNALSVTDPEALIAYAESMMASTATIRDMKALGEAVRQRIAREGTFHIQKDAGMFIATKAQKVRC